MKVQRFSERFSDFLYKFDMKKHENPGFHGKVGVKPLGFVESQAAILFYVLGLYL